MKVNYYNKNQISEIILCSRNKRSFVMCSFGQICYHKLSEETFVDVFIEASDVYKTESAAFKMSCCVLILLNPASDICHKYSNTEKKKLN